jgi:hypothetical protein
MGHQRLDGGNKRHAESMKSILSVGWQRWHALLLGLKTHTLTDLTMHAHSENA